MRTSPWWSRRTPVRARDAGSRVPIAKLGATQSPAAAPGRTRSQNPAICSSSSSEKWRRKRSRTPSRWVGRARASSASPGVGQHREAAAAVGHAGVADDQALALEPVDEARDARAAQQHAVGQLGHPQPLARRRLQVDQDVVRRQREIVRRQQLGVELADQGGVHAEEATPCAELDRGQLTGGGPVPAGAVRDVGGQGHGGEDSRILVALATASGAKIHLPVWCRGGARTTLDQGPAPRSVREHTS